MIVTTVVRTNEHLGTAFGIFQVSSYAQMPQSHYTAETLALIYPRSCEHLPFISGTKLVLAPVVETTARGRPFRENWRSLENSREASTTSLFNRIKNRWIDTSRLSGLSSTLAKVGWRELSRQNFSVDLFFFNFVTVRSTSVCLFFCVDHRFTLGRFYC